MKTKRILALVISIILISTVAVCPFTASANITTYSGTVAVLPGNTQSSAPVYSYAWLDTMIIRDDATAITSTKPTPKPSYPYSHTYDEFVKEMAQYSVLFDLDETTLTDSYTQAINAMYYVMIAMNMTSDLDTMRDYVSSYGIKLPANETGNDKVYITLVYSALKYNALYVLYEKEVSFPQGTSLEGAVAIILAAMTGTMLPSGITSITGYAVYALKKYVSQFSELPMSSNPDESEIFYWAQLITAASKNYSVPLGSYDELTQAQIDYVDYAYYASIIELIYDIHIDPLKLVLAKNSKEEYAVQRLLLETMLDAKNVGYVDDMTTEELFDLACENGYFVLEDDFYSDVFSYEFTVDKACEKVWFTPIAIADQLDNGDNKFAKIYIGDKLSSSGTTVSVPLDKTKSEETVVVTVAYDDGAANKEHVNYSFKINKANLGMNASSNSNDIVAQVQQYVDSVIPTDSEKANSVVSGVFSGVNNVVSNIEDSTIAANDGELTTYATTQPSTIAGYNGEAEELSSGLDFDYLADLVDSTYATDENGNIVTTQGNGLYDTDKDADNSENQSVFQKATTVIKENPEIVAAPTSAVALCSIAGFLFTKRKKNMENALDEKVEEKSDSDNDDWTKPVE